MGKLKDLGKLKKLGKIRNKDSMTVFRAVKKLEQKKSI